MSRTTRAILAAAVLAALIGAPASAQAGEGTILYIQGGNVWMTTPDGSQRHQVTDDGGWSYPSMADDGTIVAVHGGFTLVRMDAQGTVLSAFDPTPVFPTGIADAQVSGDGEYITYWSLDFCGGAGCFQQSIVYADGRQTEEVAGVVQNANGTWLPGNEIALGQYGVQTLAPGDADETEWFRFDDLDGDLEDGPDDIGSISVDDAGTLLMMDARAYYIGDPDIVEDDEALNGLLFYGLTGPPPAKPTRFDCVVPRDETGATHFDTVALAPDGDGFLVELSTDDVEFVEQTTDILIARGFDPATCSPQLAVLEENAIDPFWSAAEFDPGEEPGPGPTPGPDPGPEPAQPDEPRLDLLDGGRLDGGGSADPVGQTVAASFDIWADGGATFVVLATADRFPDALAGAALAGENGPILVTPFGEQLDPRVEAEIARVTGVDGFVLVLGGTAAVTESAAAQARAAAGSDGCAAPFPVDCRYAGTGREHTAALVGQTVLAMNQGPGGRVLLARGDAFADAITGGAYAAEVGVPILLTPPNQLHATTEAFIADNEIAEVIVLGGTAAVDQPTMDAIPTGTRRIEGSERTATAAAIATELWDAEGLAGGGVVLVNVRHDDGWQTALSAAVVSALANAPQLGVENPPTGPSDPTVQAAAGLGGPVVVFGPAELVSDVQLSAVQAAG